MLKYIRNNYYELIIAFLVFANLFPVWLPKWMYYASFLFILYKMSIFNVFASAIKRDLFIGFIATIWLSSILGAVLDLRLVVFTLILFMGMPRSSVRWHIYKKKMLFNIFIGFGIATLVNLFAKLIDVNMVREDKYMISMGRVSEFSGFCSHPMWTSCAAALSTIFFSSMAFGRRRMSKVWKFVCFAMILVSLYITMISASRSAFFLSLFCSAIVIKLHSGNWRHLTKVAFVITITSLFFAPFLIDNSKAMMQKKNSLEITVKNTSRDELWSQRMEEFESSPLIGIGFAAYGVGENKTTGRFESGGSFIGVLAQTGLIGSMFVALIWMATLMHPKRVDKDQMMQLIYAIFVFFSIHCIIEGYMFQAGWYLCLIVWLVVGVMIEHKQYGAYIYRLQIEK